MANEYYDHTAYPATGALGTSAAMRAELEAIEAGFSRLPTLSGNALEIVRVNTGATALEGSGTTLANVDPRGVHTIFVPAAGMTPSVTNGPSSGTTELTATTGITARTLDFDTTTSESAQFMVALPNSYNLGTLTARFHWLDAGGTGNVVWRIYARCVPNDVTMSGALFSTATSATADTATSSGVYHVTDATSAFTPDGTIGDTNMMFFKIDRDTTTDTMTGDAKLLGVTIKYTTDAPTDA